MLKISSKYMLVFTSKFICNNLYLLFVIFIIYLQSSKNKSICYNWNLTLNDWFICKVNDRGNFVGKFPWLMCIICLTYCFLFLSVIVALFDIAFSIFKLKDFSFSNSFVPLPFIKLGNFRHSLTSHMEIVKRC